MKHFPQFFFCSPFPCSFYKCILIRILFPLEASKFSKHFQKAKGQQQQWQASGEKKVHTKWNKLLEFYLSIWPKSHAFYFAFVSVLPFPRPDPIFHIFNQRGAIRRHVSSLFFVIIVTAAVACAISRSLSHSLVLSFSHSLSIRSFR